MTGFLGRCTHILHGRMVAFIRIETEQRRDKIFLRMTKTKAQII